MSETIYTLNSRDNFYLEFVKEYFNLSEDVIHYQINNSFCDFLEILKRKKINYQDLKSGLVPSMDRKEMVLVFDTAQMKDNWYSYKVFQVIIPLLDKKSCHSVRCGDYIGDESIRSKLREEFFNEIRQVSDINYIHHSQFFLVYINNLTDNMVETLSEGLKMFPPYVGFFDVTFTSFIKTYISTKLCNAFIKSKNIVIEAIEEDADDNVDENMYSDIFEEHGYTCRSVKSTMYDLFLSYKIERKVYKGFETDTQFSLNAISRNVLDITDFNLQIEEKKLKHLLIAKAGNFKRKGLINMSVSDLEEFVKREINSNYIYNLTLLKEHETIKFNIIIETMTYDTKERVRILVGLEYKPEDKTLRLITMY